MMQGTTMTCEICNYKEFFKYNGPSPYETHKPYTLIGDYEDSEHLKQWRQVRIFGGDNDYGEMVWACSECQKRYWKNMRNCMETILGIRTEEVK